MEQVIEGNKIIQILQDFSTEDPTCDSYEQRILRDNDFEVAAVVIENKIELEVLQWVMSLECHPEYIKERVLERINEINNNL